MQAMSFAVHIPLVCFGIAFPAMVVFLEGLWLRTGDPLYKALAKRWSKAMLILFAIGVVTGHDPLVRDGSAVARVHGELRRRVRARVRNRGLLVLHGGDLHRDLRVRLGSPLATHAHLGRRPGDPGRLHRLVHGDLGQRLDEPAHRLLDPQRRGRRRPPAGGAVQQEPLARADAHVPGRLPRGRLPGRVGLRLRLAARPPRPAAPGRARGGAQLRRAGGRAPAAGRRLGRPHGRRASAGQARRLRGPAGDDQGRSLRAW